MQLKKISATMLITISGSLLSADAMSSRLEEVTVTGFSNMPTFTSSSSGSGGLRLVNFGGSNPNFSFGNPNLDRIAEEERQRLEEKKKERDKKEKKSCEETADSEFDSCRVENLTTHQLLS